MRDGFTLIELLIVISIIGILSTIGLVVYSGVQNKAQDAKKRQDIDAIATAYELNYNSRTRLYPKPSDDAVSGGVLLSPDYKCKLEGQSPSFKVCAILSDGVTEYCRSSSRGIPPDCDTGVVQ